MSQEKKIPSPLTAQKLRAIALRYLDRFATSRLNLERVLMRHVQKSHFHHQTDMDEARNWLKDLLDQLEKNGLLDDQLYAEGRAAALHRKGTSLSHIRMKLREKGLKEEVIQHALKQLADDPENKQDLDYQAAFNYARRRRLGPFRREETRLARQEKDMAALARAGFGYDLARRIIEAKNTDEL